jgi:biopolymer transport protein ExbD
MRWHSLFIVLAVGGCSTHGQPDVTAPASVRDVVGAPVAHNSRPAPQTDNFVTLEPMRGGPARVTVNGRRVTEPDLVRGFSRYIDRSQRLVVVDAGAAATYGEVMEVIEAASESGACRFWAINRVSDGIDRAQMRSAAIEIVPLLQPCSTTHTSRIDDRQEIVVDVYPPGRVVLDGRDEPTPRLLSDVKRIVAYHRARPGGYSTTILLGGERSSSWDLMIQAADAANQAEASSVKWLLFGSDQEMQCGPSHYVGPGSPCR